MNDNEKYTEIMVTISDEDMEEVEANLIASDPDIEDRYAAFFDVDPPIDEDMPPYYQVFRFRQAYGLRSNVTLAPGFDDYFKDAMETQLTLINEEYQELQEAIEAEDIVEAADAIGDLLYVVYGLAFTLGIDADMVFREIHRSNMTKLGEDGKPIYREDGKVLKGPNFEEPRIKELLDLQADIRQALLREIMKLMQQKENS